MLYDPLPNQNGYHLQNIQGLLDSKGKISDMRTKGQLLVKNDAKKLYFVLMWQDAVFQEEGWDLFPLSGTSKPRYLHDLETEGIIEDNDVPSQNLCSNFD